MKLIICLHNIRSAHNVGSILRTAEGFGIEKVVFSGYTPMPIFPDQMVLMRKRGLLPHLAEKIRKDISKTALGAESMLEIEYTEKITNRLEEFRAAQYEIVGLENNIEDNRLMNLTSSSLKMKIGEKVVLILGEEIDGISRELFPLIDLFLEIPMKGKKESFNVSVAAGIAMYELTRNN